MSVEPCFCYESACAHSTMVGVTDHAVQAAETGAARERQQKMAFHAVMCRTFFAVVEVYVLKRNVPMLAELR